MLQNDDQWRFWLSVNKGFGPLHLGGNVNFYVVDYEHDSLGNADRMTWHIHLDYYLCKHFSPVVEFNGYHVLDEGQVVVPFQGVDLANFGGGKNNEVVTVGIGGELRVIDNLALRLAYETPLTKGNDMYGYRWTASAVLSF